MSATRRLLPHALPTRMPRRSRPRHPALACAALLLTAAPLPAQQAESAGEATFRAVCATCHSLQPPALQAPPMAHIARHYLAADTAREAVVQRIVRWVREPAAERSLLPPMARERWGLMPPLQLPEPQLRDVATYVLTLADTPAGARPGHMRHGRGAMRGRGMMMRGGG